MRDRLRGQTDEHGSGMLSDLIFAVVWVALISALFQFVFVDAQQWVYYLFMLAGIPAYFAFFFSLEHAKQMQKTRESG